jgi:hypoxanthine phosphoribosyltransferase
MNTPQTLNLEGRIFEKFITYTAIQRKVTEIAHNLNQRNHYDQPILMPILTGAYRFFAELIPHLQFQYLLDFIKISSYGASTLSGAIEWGLKPSLNIKGKNIILIEDIVDTGQTLDFLIHSYLLPQEPASVIIATLLYKPQNNKSSLLPDVVGFSVPPDFIIGFGLDFNHQGRSLNDLYICKSD